MRSYFYKKLANFVGRNPRLLALVKDNESRVAKSAIDIITIISGLYLFLFFGFASVVFLIAALSNFIIFKEIPYSDLGYLILALVLTSVGLFASFIDLSTRALHYEQKLSEELLTKKTRTSFLLKIADILPKKQRIILQQEARDMKEEYDEAITLGKPLRAKVIIISYYSGVVWSVFKWVADKIKEIFGVIPKKN